MVLVFSEAFDMSTDEVCDWISHFGESFTRINGSAFSKNTDTFSYALTCIDNKPDFSFVINGAAVNAQDISAIWFRRDEAVAEPAAFRNINDAPLRAKLGAHAVRELARNKEYFYYVLLDKPHLGNHLKKEVNKFAALMTAAKNGLRIPDTILSNDMAQQDGFLAERECIIKSVRDTDFFTAGSKEVFVSYTNTVRREELQDDGFPSLIQQKIDKEIEIRIFYLKGTCYAMAIFSQLDAKTAVDFRKYNYKKPNRYVPYQLPLPISTAVIRTMQDLNLDTGSIDLIKAGDGSFYFLEVNPVGQFGMTSKPCNYYIEKDIARILTNKNAQDGQ
jgi:ATP-GRASP peptide maturase of grasp-with-spasm system